MKYFFPRRKLTADEFSIIPEAFWRLFTARVKVSFFRSVKYLPSPSQKLTIYPTQEKVKKGKTVALIINGLSLRTPWSSTCLVKVLAAHSMLKKRKIAHTLHFGVKKNTAHQLDAHAWLSVGEEKIIGDENLHFFIEISKIII